MKTSDLALALIVAGAVVASFTVDIASASDGPKNDAPKAGAPQKDANPVLVELFTSEGCSSCPPADALLQKLDSLQPVSGTEAIVLSEHVDYWNHDGWKDAYSSSFFTDRQQNYEQRLRVKEPYTPQMVVDGAAQLNGSNGPAVLSAVEAAGKHAKIPVRISSLSVENTKNIHAHLLVDALPDSFKTRKADIFVAIALSHAESHVSAGENKGRDIQHVAVAELIDKVGTVEKGKNFDRDILVKLKSAPDLANLRVVGFVQESDGGEVLGASLLNNIH
jgi:hypothetical protein